MIFVRSQRYSMKLDRITSNPNRMDGQPCTHNLRLTGGSIVFATASLLRLKDTL